VTLHDRGGIWWDRRELSIMNCLRGTLWSLPNAILNNFVVWRKRSKKRLGRRHGVILQHHNARTHTANVTKAAIQELDWEILPHPPYSPDLAPLDYHIFRTLSNNLRGVSFNNDAELQNWLDEIFTSK
jgi:histone-lysine N-methyltransferase SETMAR